jgi:hypothetical protein
VSPVSEISRHRNLTSRFNRLYPTLTELDTPSLHSTPLSAASPPPLVIDSDDSEPPQPHTLKSTSLPLPKEVRQLCPGFLLQFPDGQTAFSHYPWGLHDKVSMGFEISGIAHDGLTMTLHSVMCHCQQTLAKACPSCALLGEDSYLRKIISWLEEGVKESTNLVYFGIDGLHEIIH